MVAARSMDIRVRSDVMLFRKDWALHEGIWNDGENTDWGSGWTPQAVIPKYKPGKWGSESNGFMEGTKGSALYGSCWGDVEIYWSNPYWGSNEVRVTCGSDKIRATVADCSGYNVKVEVKISRAPGVEVKDGLAPGQRFSAGERLVSENGRAILDLQDGNLVLYRASDRRVLWDSETVDATFAIMQHDGNFVARSDWRPYWSTGTQWGGSRCLVQDDANLVVYDTNGKVVWQSDTVHDWNLFDEVTEIRRRPNAAEAFTQAVGRLYSGSKNRYGQPYYRVSGPALGADLVVEEVSNGRKKYIMTTLGETRTFDFHEKTSRGLRSVVDSDLIMVSTEKEKIWNRGTLPDNCYGTYYTYQQLAKQLWRRY